MTKRSEQQRLDRRGEAHLELQLEKYVVNSYENDFGLDFEVNLTEQEEDDEFQHVTGEHLFIQLKSSSGFENDDSVHADLKITHLTQYLEQPIPVLLAIYDDDSGEIYWCVVQEFVWDELSNREKNWREQTTVRVRINRSRNLTNHDRLETAVQRAQNRITRQQSYGMNIGEGIAFTPDDFTELQRQVDNDRLSYRGHLLLKARQHLKRGDFEAAEESISEISESEHDDEAKVKALFMEMMTRNPANADEAVEMAEFAHEAETLARDLGLEADELLARVHKHVAGLFVILEKREEMVATDSIQDLDQFNVSEYDYLRDRESRELLTGELNAAGEINRTLADLRENDQYYVYAVCLSPIIDYLLSRIMVNVLSPRNEQDIPDSVHPLVEQATQIADFIPDPETEFNLRKSVGLYHYQTLNPETAKEFLKDARDLAVEIDDRILVKDTEQLLDKIDTKPDPYDHSEETDYDDIAPEEATKRVLEVQGIDVDMEGDQSTESYDPMATAARLGVEDADPEEYYRHCEHLHLAYQPSFFGKVTGVTSIGSKSLWCQHGGGMTGASLKRLFSSFTSEFCDGCDHHCPRSNEWELTDEFAEEQVNDPEFQEFLEAKDSAFTSQ